MIKNKDKESIRNKTKVRAKISGDNTLGCHRR